MYRVSFLTGAPLKFTSMEKSLSIRTGALQTIINFEVIVMGTCTFEDESMQQASAKDYWCSLSALFKHSVINFVQNFFVCT